ncbi:acyl-CoA dehydrogenase [Arthrobacter sp. MMS18-M83]|uniref:acyl-CoA dehydrogenase n=1 Tax=Arthrobacter sp. MMS18-M83 TaxID=2996261 RepID=UPI00227A8F90|nr:acyl-CoA dehydrogenase [Arthrobacter sp. MMS18-M83]WAH97706.1 acyl-CoA dehydrogenase [Arthrobacter sp. MMS18-M83]
MGLAINEEHQQLAEVARVFLKDADAHGVVRGALDGDMSGFGQLWSGMAEQGWQGLHLPEEYGGEGFGIPEIAIVVEELGRTLATGAFTATVVTSAVIAALGSDEVRSGHLPGLADGGTVGSIGLRGSLIRSEDSYTGSTGPLIGGQLASLGLFIAGEDAVLVPLDAPGVTVAPVQSFDPTMAVAEARFEDLSAASVAIFSGGARLVRQLARTLAAAEAAGAARASLDLALDYAKIRHQFGRAIGSFQAIKHHLANMLVQSELAVAAVWDAARTGVTDHQAELAADAAAAAAFKALIFNAQQSMQIHGGIGFTWEHDAHLYMRRSRALPALLGPEHVLSDAIYDRIATGEHRKFTLDLPEEAEEFRASSRAFLASYRSTPESERRELLASSGYQVPHWPPPFGRGAGAIEQLVIEEELVDVELPNLGIGGWVLLTLVQQANPEQIERWIPASLRGEHQWCQLFSEPGAGSDAAAVSTRAVKVDGGWRVNGQKVWTSGAQDCSRGLATVRTDRDAPKHKGITAMAVDMHAPGVTVRPLREITGEFLFNEVFFDDVFIPDADVVGAVNEGWTVARATLGNERVSIGAGSREGLTAQSLTDILAKENLADDASFTRQVSELIVEEHAMRLLNLRSVVRAVINAGPGPEGNLSKLLSAEHAQRVSELAIKAGGATAIVGGHAETTFEYLFDRALTIAGGTSEITRNVIAERLLGLPRDPLNK